MGRFQDFANNNQEGCEKLYGTYGCKFCDEDMETAWWNPNLELFFWVCSKGHRSEHKLV